MPGGAAVARTSAVHWDHRHPNAYANPKSLRRKRGKGKRPSHGSASELSAPAVRSAERLAATRDYYNNTASLNREHFDSMRRISPTRSPQRAGSFTEQLSAADGRQQKLMLLQKKMQLSEAMEKKLRYDQGGAGGRARPKTPELRQAINEQVDSVFSTQDFVSSFSAEDMPMGEEAGSMKRTSFADADFLQRGRLRLSEVQGSQVLDEIWRNGTPASAKPVRLGSSLPDIASPSRSKPGQRSMADSRRSSRSSRSNHSTSERLWETSASRVSPHGLDVHTRQRYAEAEVQVKRRVRDQKVELNSAFVRADTNGSGTLARQELRNILFRHNIVMDDGHFMDLLSRTDPEAGLSPVDISYRHFLKFFGTGQEADKKLVGKVAHLSRDEACKLIRAKIFERLDGGVGGLQKTFKFFDADRSGSVNIDEFAEALRTSYSIVLEPHTLVECFDYFTDGGASDILTMDMFIRNVMGSGRNDRTSLEIRILGKQEVISDDNGNSEQMLRRKVALAWKSIRYAFLDRDPHNTGCVTPQDLREILEMHDIFMTKAQFADMCRKIDADGDGHISYKELNHFFSLGKLVADVKSDDLTPAQALDLIRVKLAERLESGNGGLYRGFKVFDRDASGMVSFKEFRRVVSTATMLEFEESLLRQIFLNITGNAPEMDFENFKMVLLDVDDTHTQRVASAVVDGRSSSVAQLHSHKDGLRMEWEKAEADRVKHAAEAEDDDHDMQRGVTVNEFRQSLGAYGLTMAPRMLASIPRVQGTDGALIDYDAALQSLHTLDDDGDDTHDDDDDQQGNAAHEQQLHQARVKRIREQWAEIQIDLVRRQHMQDHIDEGSVQDGLDKAELRKMLLGRGIVFSDWSFAQACEGHECGRDRVNSRTFLLQFHDPRQRPPSHGFGALIREKDMSVEQAVILVRQKLKGRLASDTGGLLAGFKFFDRDNGGKLTHDEIRTGLTQYLGLHFDRPLLEKLLAKYDPGGTGEVDLHGFEARVMGSTQADETGYIDHVAEMHVSESNGNTNMQLTTKIRENLRKIQAQIRVAAGMSSSITHGAKPEAVHISPTVLRRILDSMDIIFADEQYEELVAKIDADNSGTLTMAEFLSFFAPGQKADLDKSGSLGGLSVDQGMALVRRKLDAKIKGGPSSLRQAFNVFDRDGTGTVSRQEFQDTLKNGLGIAFEPALFDDVYNKFDIDGAGQIDRDEFIATVLETSKDALHAGTSLSTAGAALQPWAEPSDADGNSEAFLRRKIRENWKALLVAFRAHERDYGPLTKQGLREVLYKVDIVPAQSQIDDFVRRMDADGDGSITGKEFMSFFGPGQDVDKDNVQPIRDVSPAAAKKLIREGIDKRVKGGGGLRRAFQLFDRDGSGSISREEFLHVLKHHVMIEFADSAVIEEVMREFDPTGDSHIDYTEFCRNVMGAGTVAESAGHSSMRQTVSLPDGARPSAPEVAPASDLFDGGGNAQDGGGAVRVPPLNLGGALSNRVGASGSAVREEIWRQALSTPLSRVATALSTPASAVRRSRGGGSGGKTAAVEQELTSAELIQEFAMLNASELRAGGGRGESCAGGSRRSHLTASGSRRSSTTGSWK